MFYLFFTNSFVYYGLTLNSGQLIPGDLHINIMVSAGLEILANLLTIVAFIYAGRRLSVCVRNQTAASMARMLCHNLIERSEGKYMSWH